MTYDKHITPLTVIPPLENSSSTNDCVKSKSSTNQLSPLSGTLGGRRGSTFARRLRGGGRTKARGRYKKGKKIGEGASGTVYQGIDNLTGEFIAIKEVQGNFKELKREFDMLQKLTHINIVRYRDYANNGGKLVVYLDLVDGGSLLNIMEQFGKLCENVIKNYFRQVCDGLNYLHSQQIVHRDIKPANLLVTTGGVVKVSDFGTSTILDSGSCSDGQFVGTPAYTAPEAIRGVHGFKGDTWAMGTSICELMLGESPWIGVVIYENTLEFMLKMVQTEIKPKLPHCSDACMNMLESCLQRDPDKRAAISDLVRHPFWTSVGDDLAIIRKDSIRSLRSGLEDVEDCESEELICEPLQQTFPNLTIQPDLSELEVSDMSGVFIAAHSCNAVVRMTTFEGINSSKVTDPNKSWTSKAFVTTPLTNYLQVDGTNDGLITLDGVSYKFDVFFNESTGPMGLYEKIGKPILEGMLKNNTQKTFSLTCTAMLYSGETLITIGDVKNGGCDGFLPVFMDQLLARTSGTHDVYISSSCAKRDKAALFDNLHHKLITDEAILKDWNSLGPHLRVQVTSKQQAYRMMDFSQLAFTGVMSPAMYVVELKQKGSDEFGSSLFINLFYGRQWTFWLNGLTYIMNEDSDEMDGSFPSFPPDLENEKMYQAHPLLAITKEVFNRERSMNYILHNFHTQVDAAQDLTESLTALSSAVRKKK
eukprot:TRINITY_DN6969_c0_g1_i1.p1 TRINITY_DN6969_c0_g1~~TRINITY_DN6969_c0_g1_i1.p1  ORF type:complete len:703 (+),score=86.74 TRINITY_DN6969_c0_g1_i1:69-2177(+)